MKLTKYFMALCAAALGMMAVGCEEGEYEATHLDSIQVSSSYVGLPIEGGSVQITLEAKSDWMVSSTSDGTGSALPDWFTVSPSSGTSGTYTLTFSAEAGSSTSEETVYIVCGYDAQTINVIQMAEKVDLPISTCAEVNNGEDGTTYRIKGTVTAIANTTYGNMYITDETGTVYVYGTLDASGAEKNFSTLGIELGDIVTVEGPRTLYGSTVELVNVTVIDIEKSLIKVDSTVVAGVSSAELPIEGGEFVAYLTCKGDGVTVSIPDDAKSWLSVTSISTEGDNAAVVTFYALPNELGDRNTTVNFYTTSGGKEYSAAVDIAQKGSIIDATAAEINAAEDGDTQYRLTGYITKVANTTYGNFYIADATDTVYVYGTLDESGASGKWSSMGINEGDIITVVGPKTSYKGAAQLKNVSVESVKHVQDITVAAFLALSNDKETYYRLTGKATGIKATDVYGNFDITDATGSVYVYGLLQGWGGASKQFQGIGIEEGDVITIVGYRTSYGTKDEVGGAFFISKTSGSSESGSSEEAIDPTSDTLTLTNAEICALLTSSESSYQDYQIASASGTWTVNASQSKDNTFLQCRGRLGSYIKTPLYTKDIKSVTIHFSEAKSVYANNTYAVFPSTWTAPTEDAAYPSDGNVGTAVTDDTYSLTIPVDAGNKQVSIAMVEKTYAYYLDHIDVAF